MGDKASASSDSYEYSSDSSDEYSANGDYDYVDRHGEGGGGHDQVRRPPPRSEGWPWGDMFISPSEHGGGDCCPHVVDPLALCLFLAGIAIVAFYLNMQITMNLGRKRRRRRSGDSDLRAPPTAFLFEGNTASSSRN
jgi:hypothetical protein